MGQVNVFIDFLPNGLNLPGEAGEQEQAQYIENLKRRIDDNGPEIAKRHASLPQLLVFSGPHAQLLDEARKLYIDGYFYACVAMCGITAERIVSDIFAATILIRRDRTTAVPASPTALKQLRPGARQIREFLEACGVLSAEKKKQLEELATLRNKYTHATGDASASDAVESLTILHRVVEGTVSVFKDFKIHQGKLIPREDPLGPDPGAS